MNGTKHDTEAAGIPQGVRTTNPGGTASDHAGTSNDKTGENPVRRKPKVSWGR